MPLPQCHITGTAYLPGSPTSPTGASAAGIEFRIVKGFVSGQLISTQPIHIYADANGVLDFYLPQGAIVWVYSRLYGLDKNGPQGVLMAVPAASSATIETLLTNVLDQAPANVVPLAVPGGGGSGTVTSVAMTVPSWLSVSGSPITTAGTLALTAASGQTANRVLASPDGASGALSVRALVANDIPNLAASKITSGTLPVARGGTGIATIAADKLVGSTALDTIAEIAIGSGLSLSGGTLSATGGGGSLTVEEADGAPSLASTTTLRFDQADGFVISNPGAGIARVDLANVPVSALAALTVSRALISNGSGVIAVSAVTDAELAHLSGVTSAIQTQLNSKQAGDPDLTALAALSSTGIVTRTASDTYALRSVAGGTGINVTNGDGVAGNPTVAIDSTVATLTGSQTLTNKTLTAPTINGGTHTAMTSLGIRSTGTGAFDLTLANSENLTAARTLTIAVGDAARTLTLGGNTTLNGGTHSGTNTGDQTITLTGDVTGSGTGSFAATIANDAVTYAKMQNVSAASRLLGRGDSGSGDVQEITLGSGLSMSGTTLSSTGSSLPVADTTEIVQGSVDSTKRIRFEVDGLTTGTTRVITPPDSNTQLPIISQILTFTGPTAARTLTLPDESFTVAGVGSTQTLTNKTLSLGSNTVSGTIAQFNTALSDGDFATLAGSETLTNKTLTAPTINGGTHTAITSLGIRSTGTGAFDLTLANTENLTAGRTLTVTVNDAARTLSLGGNLTTAAAFTTSGANALTLTTTASTNVTLPTTGTLATLAGTETLSNKTVNTVASTTGSAGLNLPHGTAPTTPANGDVWTTTSGMFVRVNGSTVGPLGTGGGSPGGSNKQIQFNNSSAFGGAAGFEYQSGASPNVLIAAQNATHTALRINSAVSPTVPVFEVSADNGTTTHFKVTSTGAPSAPGAGSGSERFGSGSTAGGDNSLAIGNAVSAPGADNIVIGYSISPATNTGHVLIGKSVTSGTLNDVLIGNSTSGGGGGYNVAIGFQAVTANGGVALGGQATNNGQTFSIALGYSATNTAGNQFVAGSNGGAINNVFFGKGVTDTTPTAYTINGTGGSGTNIAGAALQLAGGKATGNAASGVIDFQTSDAGSSGTTLQSLTTKLSLSGSNLILTSGGMYQFGSSGVATPDTGIARAAVKVVGFTDGSTNGGTYASVATSPAQITANQNNYNPGGSSYIQRWTTDAARDVTGLTFTATQVSGQTHIIVNAGSNNIVLKHQNASSTAANRFICTGGVDITLAADESAYVVYDASTQRWRAFKL